MAALNTERRKAVLHAIVAEYIATKEPVGSKTLVNKHALGVSSSTIRNDMAYLEKEGYITQPHISSGRVPTQKAYREFVDSIQEYAPISRKERDMILSSLESGVDMEDVLYRSVTLLSQLTHHAAVVQLPSLNKSTIKHIELVLLAPTRLLMVIITDTGRVDQRHVDFEDIALEADDALISSIRTILNEALVGQGLDTMRPILHGVRSAVPQPSPLATILDKCITILIDTLAEAPTERLLLAGTSHVSETPSILEALEEQGLIVQLLSAVNEAGKVKVSIGSENGDDQLHTATIIATGYGVGGLGVLGPTCMDYSGTISKVSTVAQYVRSVLGKE